MVRLRKKPHQIPQQPDSDAAQKKMPGAADIPDGLRLGGGGVSSWSVRSQWIFFAVASGACAAFNGVFAKLTTTDLTTTLSVKIAELFGLSSMETVVEYVVRGTFFALNLTFNGIMWSLFTTALARGTSTTQVSIMNTSTNFMFTAFMGYLIFSESLPLLWWLGAALLVAGNVIIGRKDESAEQEAGAAAAADGAAYAPVAQQDGEELRRKSSEDNEDVIDLGDLAEGRNR